MVVGATVVVLSRVEVVLDEAAVEVDDAVVDAIEAVVATESTVAPSLDEQPASSRTNPATAAPHRGDAGAIECLPNRLMSPRRGPLERRKIRTVPVRWEAF